METVDGQPTASSARLNVTSFPVSPAVPGKSAPSKSVARGDVGEDRPEPALGYVLERGHGIGDAVTVRVEADLVSDGADGDCAGGKRRGKRHRKVERARMRPCLDAGDVEVARFSIPDGVRDDRTCLAGCRMTRRDRALVNGVAVGTGPPRRARSRRRPTEPRTLRSQPSARSMSVPCRRLVTRRCSPRS